MTLSPQANSQKPKRHLFIWLLGLFIVAGLAYFTVLVYSAIKNPADPLDELSSTNQVTADANASGKALTTQVVTNDDPYFGSPDATVKIVEFADFQCPYCKEAVSIVKDLETRYGNRIFFQFRDFPITDSHPQAYAAAIAASCASEQGNQQFWAYHDRLFQFQDNLTDAIYIPLAEQVGLQKDTFAACFNTKATDSEVTQDYDDGVRAGAHGTPTFFINGKMVSGVIPEKTFTEVIDKLLKE